MRTQKTRAGHCVLRPIIEALCDLNKHYIET